MKQSRCWAPKIKETKEQKQQQLIINSLTSCPDINTISAKWTKGMKQSKDQNQRRIREKLLTLSSRKDPPGHLPLHTSDTQFPNTQSSDTQSPDTQSSDT
jgi:hypothetical protein